MNSGESNPAMVADDDVISLLDIGVVIDENLSLLIFAPLVAGLIALGVSFQIKPTLPARTSFLPPQQQQSSAAAALSQLGALSGLASSAAGLKNPTDHYIALLKSGVVADRVIDRLRRMVVFKTQLRVDTRGFLAARSRINAGTDGLITIEIDDHDPKLSADIANMYVAELRRLMGAIALTEAQQRRTFFGPQLEATKARLTTAEQALGSIGVSRTVKSDPKAAVETVARFQAQVAANEVRLVSQGYLAETAHKFRRAQRASPIFGSNT